MAKDTDKKTKQKEKKETSKREHKLSGDTKNSILAVICFIVALVFILAFFGAAGPAGNFLYEIFSYLFGVGYLLVPTLCILLGTSLFKEDRPEIAFTHTIGGILFLGSSLALVDAANKNSHSAGAFGQLFFWPFLKLFGTYAGIIFVGGLLIISIMLIFNARPDWQEILARIKSIFSTADKKIEDLSDAPDEVETEVEVEIPVEEEEEPEPIEEEEEEETTDDEDLAVEVKPKTKKFVSTSPYIRPPLSLLAGDKGKPNTGDIKANSNIIKRTLQNFGIEVEMDEITVGPSVTRYALKPAQGVKLSRITALSNDLSLALAAHPIRIEAPIPGKSLVGIEIPNKAKSIVGLASLLSDDKFVNAEKHLMVALGRNIAGMSTIANLAKMPHALIAGATGSGKSVTIHAIITSLLYRNGPEDLRFIFVDPKRVELTLYNKIPHLLTPVITDPKKAILALKWAAKEMERRYNMLEKETCRDIESYNLKRDTWNAKKGDDEQMERLPFIVVVIDELADIMQSYPRELESGIVRLAQMSRAVGIHLILSTQRPSVNVVTGLIKANIPARVALQVASQIDSRTILDAPGAEKLLGAGDMLYSSGEMASPERLQSAFISEEEVKKVVKFLIDNSPELDNSEIALTSTSLSADRSIFEASIDNDEADDDLYEEARQIVIETQKASTSFLQRKLGVGYARAARLIDMLEERGIVGAGNGAKPREVIEKPAGNLESM